MDNCLSIASLNAQGLGETKKRRDVMNYLRNRKHDIYFLQDTHWVSKLEPYIASEWGYTCFFASFSSNSRGVAILFNNTFEFKVLDVIKGEDGNFLFVHIQVKGREILLINIYGPNRDNPNFYKQIQRKIELINPKMIILGGDGNLVLDPKKDYDNYRHINNPNA